MYFKEQSTHYKRHTAPFCFAPFLQCEVCFFGVSVLRKVIVRKRLGVAGLAPDVILTQTYGQGLTFCNVAP